MSDSERKRSRLMVACTQATSKGGYKQERCNRQSAARVGNRKTMTKQNMTKAHKCKARTRVGKPCRMAALQGSDFCFNHEPSAAIERAKARKRGGENRHAPHAGDAASIPADITTIEAAAPIVRYVLDELLAMDNSIPRARALLACFDSFVKAFEIGDLEKRIAALENLKR